MRRVVMVVLAVVFGALGPRFTAPRDHAAGTPFVFEPPAGFTIPKPSDATAGLKSDEHEWVMEGRPGRLVVPRVHLRESSARGTVEAADLQQIAKGMPAMLEEGGVTWTDIRQETRTRPDGARVGIIEGECTKKIEERGMRAADTQALMVQYRRLLFVFPTDQGSAFTTAVYGVGEKDKWQPIIEASIDTARGVAVRVPGPPGWMYGAWALVGLVVGWIVMAIVARFAKTDTKA